MICAMTRVVWQRAADQNIAGTVAAQASVLLTVPGDGHLLPALSYRNANVYCKRL